MTIVDIARVIGVSAKSVSFALNDTGRLSAALRRRIKDTAASMGYRPNLAARRLVTRGSYLVGVMLPNTQASFTGRILDGIQSVMQHENIGVLLGNGGEYDLHGVEQSIQQMLGYGVSGLIAMPLSVNCDVYAKYLSNAPFPVVQLMNPMFELGGNYVEVNNVNACYDAIRYLVELGHRKIGYIGSDFGDTSVRQRSVGYRIAMEQFGIKVNPEWVENIEVHSTGQQIAEAVRKLLARVPDLTALFCFSDTVAVEAFKVLRSMGVRVPEDFSLMGFDGMDIAYHQVDKPITTVEQPQGQIGQIAAHMLLDIIGGKPGSGISMNCRLVPGATTGPVSLAASARKTAE